MAPLGMKLLRPVLFMCVLHLAFVQWKSFSSNPYDSIRFLSTGETPPSKMSATDISASRAQNLEVLENYELVCDGYCTDSNGHQFEAFLYSVSFISPREECAAKCDSLAACKGFDVNVMGFCYVYFSDGETPSKPADLLMATNPSPAGQGDIFSGNDQGVAYSCFKKSVGHTSNANSLAEYEKVGQGYCRDAQQNRYKYLGFELGPFGAVEDCAAKCENFEKNQGFMWLFNNFCMCNFNEEDLPFNPNDAATLASIAGASRTSGGAGAGRCGIHDSDDQEGHTCYKNKNAPAC